MKLRNTVLSALGFTALAFVSCTDVDLANNDVSTPTGVESLAGDFSRTLIVDDNLYGVDNSNVLTYDISDRQSPVLVDRTPVGLAIETIYHHEGNLFIGSRSGMYVYTISRSGVPVRRGNFQYNDIPQLNVTPCDPVVANETTAFASLYTGDATGEPCGREQDFQTIVVMDVQDLDNPTLVQTHDLQSPRGLALDGNLLFVCQNENGFSVYDVSDRNNFVSLGSITNVNAWDAIAQDDHLLIVGATDVVQYDYSNPSELVELSRFSYPED